MNMQFHAMLSSPMNIVSDFATIKKEPLDDKNGSEGYF